MATRAQVQNEVSDQVQADKDEAKQSLVTPTGLYFALLTVVAVCLFAWQAPQVRGDLPLLFFLIGLNIAAGLMPIVIYGDSYVSVGFVVTLAIIVLFGPPGAVILGPLAVLGPKLRLRQLSRLTLANAALFTVVDCSAAAAYTFLSPINPSGISLEMGAGVAAATVVGFSLNATLFSVPFLLTREMSISALRSQHSWLLPHYIAMGVVGFALAAAYVALGIAGIVAFATPAIMMRIAMKQYVDKTKESVEQLKTQNEQLQQANIEVRRVSDELRDSYDGTLEALVNALDARDQETKGHSLRVSRYMMEIARELGVKEGTQDWLDMQRGSLLHDVGKIGVSDSILLKPGKLTDDEWTLMRLHPEIGYNMLKQVNFLSGAAEIILSHHERWDGKGYPRGLANNDIILGARIFTVVDTFDSMTSDRPYRRALSTQEALNEILRYSGSQFDPLVVEAFLDIYEVWVKERAEMHGVASLAA